MSDASGQEPIPAAVASGTSTETDSSTQHRRGARLALIARTLATAGALLFAVGAWMPWAVVTGYATVGNQRQNYTLALSPGDLDWVGRDFSWNVVTIVGVVLLPLLWSRSLPGFKFIYLWGSWIWLGLAGFWGWIALTAFEVLPRAGLYNAVLLRPESNPHILFLTQLGSLLFGFWITLLGMCLSVSGATISILMYRSWPKELQQEERPSVEPAARPRVLLPGASALTIGIALWAVGTFVMPWASVNCNINPLILGTCTGLSYTSVLHVGIADATNMIDPLVAQHAVGLLLGGGAAMVLVGLWLRARSMAFCGWATLWLVVAAGFAWLADYGVGVVIEKHDALGLPAGIWSGENAVLVTLLGFVLALGGLAYLWVDALRNRQDSFEEI